HRAFVVFVENATKELRTYRLTIAEQPAGGKASFLQFEQRNFLDMTIAPRSSIARSVYVTSADPRASTKVNVVEIASIGGAPKPSGLQSSVVLNPDILNPDILNPDILNPDILNPDILNTDPDVLHADKSKLQINDIFWTIKNNGNTTSAYSFNLKFRSRPKGFKFQLLIYRVSSTPAVKGCAPVNQQHEQLV